MKTKYLFIATVVIGMAAMMGAGSVRAATFYVATNGSPAGPGTAWANAFNTIQGAVNAAANGDTVLVTNGVYATGGAVTPGYTLTNLVCITNAITVQSVNGPSNTWIVGAKKLRCVYLNTGAVVSGFTLTNGNALTTGDNYHDESGGGAYCESGGTLTNCVVTGNSTPASGIAGGGGVCSFGGTINNCLICGNTSDSFGGGFFGNATMNNCIICNNTADTGGGLDLNGGTINNCLIYGNYAANEAAAINASYITFCEIDNCTIANNVYTGDDVGGENFDGSTVLVYNTIIADNIVYFYDIYGGTFTNSCGPGLSGSGNISSDPQFINASAGDYRLRSSSHCVDSGANAYAPGSVDLDGNPRIVNGTVDMGAYEFQRLVVITNPPGAVSVACTTSVYTVSGTNAPSLVGNLSWTNQATGASGTLSPVGGSWTIAGLALGPGDNQILVSGADASGLAGCDAVLITRAALDPGKSPIYYVWAGSPAPTWPYTNWTTAAHNIQDAVDTANTNVTVTVLVSNGVYNAGGAVTPGYTLMNRVCITNALTVTAVGGPSVTFIAGETDAAHPGGANSVRCVYLTANASLNGFTLMNGDTAEFGNNIGDSSGGGALLHNGGALSNCVITGCTSRRNGVASVQGGGGVFCDAGGTLKNCAISSNSAHWYGGGVFCYNGGVLINCLLATNSCGDNGGGAYCESGGALTNCTVSGNSATSGGSGIACDGGGMLNNCIVYFNPGSGNDIYQDSTTITYSCSPGLSGGGNLTNNPLFVNAAAGNYRLMVSSPCVNAGANASWMTNATDLDGNPRILGGTVDMGAYEYLAPVVTITNPVNSVPGNQATIVISGTNNAFVTGTMGYTNAASGAAGSFPAQPAWNSPAVSLAYGTNLITITGTNNAGGGSSASITIMRGPPSVMYVASSGSNVWPYATWGTAATTIQAVINIATNGDTLLVSNGVYAAGGVANASPAISNRVCITAAITVQSVNGPAVTSIVGAPDPKTGGLGTNATRCVFMSSGILAGFTLTNGYTRADSDWNYQEGGGGALVTGGVISNCIATGCFASHFGGGVDLFGGDAWNCTIAGNTAYDGGGLKVQGDNAVNCLVYGNHANDSGGGVYFWESGTLDNCTVVGNVATNQGGGVYCYLGGTNLNTIIYSNSVAGAITNWTTNSGGMFQYCCTTPNPGGTGNLTNNPLFVNAAAGNYQIASNSPCINAGTNLSWMTNATDLDSNPRIVGGVVDVGAYENTNGVTANGIPWAWLLQYGLATDGSVDKLDLDGTGFNTLQDYIAGTNPTNAASCFHITSVSNLPPWTVYFGSSSNRSYTLCSRTNLTVGAWLAIPGQSNVVGAGGMMSLRDTNTAATRFYRVQVTLP